MTIRETKMKKPKAALATNTVPATERFPLGKMENTRNFIKGQTRRKAQSRT